MQVWKIKRRFSYCCKFLKFKAGIFTLQFCLYFYCVNLKIVREVTFKFIIVATQFKLCVVNLREGILMLRARCCMSSLILPLLLLSVLTFSLIGLIKDT